MRFQHLLALEPELADYQPFHAAKADLLARSGRKAEAFGAYAQAIALSASPAEIAFLQQRQDRLSG